MRLSFSLPPRNVNVPITSEMTRFLHGLSISFAKSSEYFDDA